MQRGTCTTKGIASSGQVIVQRDRRLLIGLGRRDRHEALVVGLAARAGARQLGGCIVIGH